jgi:hypothetical protein
MHARNLIVLCAGLAAASPAFAHHSASAFDMTAEPVVVDGIVAELEWKNPHIYLVIETTDADGATALQEVEVGPLASVQTYGLTQEAVAPGTHVVVRANPNRRGGGRIVRGLDVTTDDGAVYLLAAGGRDQRQAELVPADSIAARWVPGPAAFRGYIQASVAWPLTAAGLAARAETSGATTLFALCEVFPPPALTSVPALRTIEVGEQTVVMRIDADGAEVIRTIHLDQAQHPADIASTVLGHSIGRWEGETLVIDTVGFAPYQAGVAMGVPSGPGKRLVERLSLAEDRTHLAYEFTLEDPDYLVEPVTHAMVWDHRPDVQPSDVACDPEVGRRYLEE